MPPLTWTTERLHALHVLGYLSIPKHSMNWHRRREILVYIFTALADLTKKNVYDQWGPRNDPKGKKSTLWPEIDLSQSGGHYTQLQLDRFAFWMDIVTHAANALNITIPWGPLAAPFVGGNAANYLINQAERDAALRVNSPLAANAMVTGPQALPLPVPATTALVIQPPATTTQAIAGPSAMLNGPTLSAPSVSLPTATTAPGRKRSAPKRKTVQRTKRNIKRKRSYFDLSDEDEESAAEDDILDYEDADISTDDVNSSFTRKRPAPKGLRKPSMKRTKVAHVQAEEVNKLPSEEEEDSSDSEPMTVAARGGKSLPYKVPKWKDVHYKPPMDDDSPAEEDGDSDPEGLYFDDGYRPKNYNSADSQVLYSTNTSTGTETFADVQDRLYTEGEDHAQHDHSEGTGLDIPSNMGPFLTPFDPEWADSEENASLERHVPHEQVDFAATPQANGAEATAEGDAIVEWDEESFHRESEAKALLDGILGTQDQEAFFRFWS